MGKTSHWMSALLGSLLILQAQPSRSQSRVVDVGPFDRANRALPTFFSRTEGWAGQGNRALARTTDGGTTWAAVVPPAIGDDPTIEIRGRYFQSASSAWIGVRPLHTASRIKALRCSAPWMAARRGLSNPLQARDGPAMRSLLISAADQSGSEERSPRRPKLGPLPSNARNESKGRFGRQ